MHITNKKLKQEILDYRIQVEVRRRKPNILTHRKKKSLHLKTLGVRLYLQLMRVTVGSIEICKANNEFI